MRTGAVYFLEKPVEGEKLIRHVTEAMMQGTQSRTDRAWQSEIEARVATLTPREAIVLQLVVQGKTSRQIADELSNSKKTIELHRALIKRKLAASTIAELVRMIVSTGQNLPEATSSPSKESSPAESPSAESSTPRQDDA